MHHSHIDVLWVRAAVLRFDEELYRVPFLFLLGNCHFVQGPHVIGILHIHAQQALVSITATPKDVVASTKEFPVAPILFLSKHIKTMP
jgi:hypothetical protein